MNELAIFNFEGKREVRTLERDGEPLFVVKDVCDILEIGNPTETLRNFPESEILKLSSTEFQDPRKTWGGASSFVCVSEPGLYRLIFQSRKPEAEAFKTWVFNEVLPAIRKKGYYADPQIQERLDKLEKEISTCLNTLLERSQFPMTEGEAKARHKLLMEEQERSLRENNLMRLPWHRPVREFICPFYGRTDMAAGINGLQNTMKEIEYTTQELQRFLLKTKEIMGE